MKLSGPKKRFLFIVPCFNERPTVGRVATELLTILPDADVLVVDDASDDGSTESLPLQVRVVRLPVNLGIGGAVQCGFLYALRNNYDFCMQVDGDGQHPASEVTKFLSAYEHEGANILIGSRFLGDETFQSTALRRLGIRLISSLLRYVTGQTITDPTSGYRLFDRAAISVFSREYSLDFPEPISLAIAAEAKLKVREIPVAMAPRSYGRSSIHGLRSVAYIIRVCGYLIAVRLRRIL